MAKKSIKELQGIAAQARQMIVEVLIAANSGHPGGAFSSVEIMTALYFHTLQVDPQNPQWPERDYFILSKGHSSVGLYTMLHLRGFIAEKDLMRFRQNDSPLGGHPVKDKVPGVEMSTGSLGHGFSVAVGLALAMKMDRRPNRVFVILGDGESQEGAVWEAAMFAAHYKLDNLTVIVDRNQIQIDGFTEQVMALEPFADKWRAFNWQVEEVDGHDFTQLVNVLDRVPLAQHMPSVILARTVKGKGISFMENNPAWHGGGISGSNIEIARRDVRQNGLGSSCG